MAQVRRAVRNSGLTQTQIARFTGVVKSAITRIMKTNHESAVVARELDPPPIEDRGLTPFAQAMPEEYRVPGDAVAAYRAFYIGAKSHFAAWKKRPAPDWFTEGIAKLEVTED